MSLCRHAIARALLATAALLVSPWSTGEDAQPSTAAPAVPPNIILILADDVGWRDLGSYGSAYHETPNLDRLAAAGARFTNAYSASPVCSPTRAAILTGQVPARVGITAPVGHLPRLDMAMSLVEKAPPGVKFLDVISASRLAPAYLTLPEALREAGYTTAHFGKWHLGYNRPGHPEDRFEPRDHGFDADYPHAPAAEGPMSGYMAPFDFIPDPALRGKPGEHIEDALSAKAVDFIRNAPADKPFYLNYWAYSAHYPWGAKPEYIRHFETSRDPRAPQQNAVYAAMIRSLDDAVGRIMAAVDEAGIADRTVIVFASDNGGQHVPPGPKFSVTPPEYQSVPVTSNLPLKSGKASLYEGGTRVPLIVRWPGHTTPGTTSSALLSLTDLYPTFLHVAGTMPRAGVPLDGIDQTAALEGKASARSSNFTYFPHGGGLEARFIPGLQPGVSVRQGDWKLIRFFGDGEDGGARLELYNLADDIDESRNLAAEQPARAKELDALITAFLQDTKAPIPVRNPDYDPAAPPEPVRLDR